jgi:hypothetical protein
MKTEKIESPNPPKQRGVRYWLTRLALLLGLPLLFYYGYCWGLWGRSSLLLQYLFQCSCPAASEEARYPEYVDVLVPACKNQGSLLSPSGRFLYVGKIKPEGVTSYLLNLETNEKISLTFKDSVFFFLSDSLFYVDEQYGGDEYLFDRTIGETYLIQEFRYSHPGSYIDGHANPIKLATALRQAKNVFLLDTKDKVIALSPDFPASPELNFYITRFGIAGDAYNRLEQFLRENNIAYVDIPFRFRSEAISPSGKLVARADGIYSVETGQRVVDMIPTSSTREQALVNGWIHDGSAVLYSYSGYPCVVETGIPMMDGSICLFRVPQPVLKLKVPEEYLLP